ncbi:hypothetical protein Y032_0089g2262 [Ancylostoma ceylanicum]|uniref:ABC-2 type transporter transmembrane domain-containing protein n=1 Tax=Ancylostoma ceylanicum TaxID=53326 RepID=A0A016TND4_9BILA|nr:hypothetical protein Y032_0089g2262 [Ancylostoma ceylanicum]
MLQIRKLLLTQVCFESPEKVIVDILICGDLTRNMDSYETAFLVDYLRDWAIKLNRVVMMAIAPTSFEILLMFSKCALLTSGRFVFFDSPTKIKSYFDSIGFSCPPYKNPCDFYVDVATHDHLSQAASLESSSRISKLIQFWEQNKPPPRCFANSPVPPSLCRPPVLRTLQTLYRQSMYEFANDPLASLREPVIAMITSLAIGFAYSSLTKEKRVGADDRIGFATAVLYLGMIPWIYVVIQKVAREKKTARNILRKTQLSSLLFLIHKISCDIPIIILTSALYCLPLPFLVGLNLPRNHQWLWIASLFCIVFTHFLLWRMVSQSLAFLSKSATMAFFGAVILLITSYLTSGLVVHSKTPDSMASFTYWISPHKWVSQALLEAEFSGCNILEAATSIPSNHSELIIGCERKEVLARKIKGIPIYTVSHCSKIRGSQLLYFYSFLEGLANDCSLTLNFFFGCSIMASWILATFFILTCSVWCST